MSASVVRYAVRAHCMGKSVYVCMNTHTHTKREREREREIERDRERERDYPVLRERLSIRGGIM